jgi:hypothetical protein
MAANGGGGTIGGPLPAPPKVGCVHLLSDDWIKAVARTPENDLRAHRIALTYHHLGLYLDELLHDDKSVRQTSEKPLHDRSGIVHNANWFNFATWATLTVAQNIGNQQPLQRLNTGPGMLLRRALTPAVLNIKASGGQQVGRALAWGQLVIFNAACNGLLTLTRHIEASIAKPKRKTWPTMKPEDLLVPLQAGAPIPDDQLKAYARYLSPLNDALRYYAEACQASDDETKARLILGANLRITQVEQDFADKAVGVVVDLVPRRLVNGIDWRLAQLAERLRSMPRHMSYVVLENLHSRERTAFDAMWSRFMTDQVLVMALPTETLRVGRDIPPLRRDRPYYPDDLTFERDLSKLKPGPFRDRVAAVAVLVRSLDRTVGDGRGSAARDWRRWDERINWALTLLRTRQHDTSLFWHPYSSRDERRIVAGELPLRSGDPSALDVQPPLDPTIERLVNLAIDNPNFNNDDDLDFDPDDVADKGVDLLQQTGGDHAT